MDKTEELRLNGFRILVVDDEPDIRTFIAAVLEDNGATVIPAVDGEEGLELARKEKPDLITLDLAMPHKSGEETFEALRKDAETAEIPVCIITGRPELRRFIYEKPVPPPEGYLEKPITEQSLLLNVRKILELSRDRK